MRAKQYLKKVLFFLMLFGIFGSFFVINSLNYQKTKEIENNIIFHPESLPRPDVAIATSFGFQNIRADIYRLKAIQYIGSNAIRSEYKKYLYVMLDLITSLNPYFENPYIIGELLLPSYSELYEDLTEEEQLENKLQAEKLGLKGIDNFCDPQKVDIILKQDDLQKLWGEEKYKNPCKSYKVPFYLAFIYYYYLHDPSTASNYYKIASTNDNGLSGAKIMTAIMQGKGGDRQKSIFMFLTMAKSTEENDMVCQAFANEIGGITSNIFNGTIPLSGELIQQIEIAREKAFGKFEEKRELDYLEDTKCMNYVNKAIRELNLFYIEVGNEQFKKAHNGNSSRHAKALFEEGYIDFLPHDFQKYTDYEIIYKFNPDTNHYDYEMGNYD